MNRAFVIILAILGGLLVFLVVLGLAILASRGVSGGQVAANTLLEIDFEAGLIEDVPDDPVARIALSDRLVLTEVVDALHRAAGDDRVVGLVARIGSPGTGLATLQELRDAIAVFRSSGKPTIAWAETFGEASPGNGAYYLACAFEKIYLQPSGDVGLTGLDFESPFFRGLADKLGVVPEFSQRYEYKNAMNNFTEKSFTPAHREATESLMQSFFGQMVTGIAEARHLTEDEVRALCDRGPFLAQEALDAGLVDGLAYRDEVYDEVETLLGKEPEPMEIDVYREHAGSAYDEGATIALIHGDGEVLRGASAYDPFSESVVMGSDTVTEAFRNAVEDDEVKVILFRVNSPGGSYVASDAIWRETVRAREAGKPVIVSMGDLAASGGYFVSMHADRIIAHPGTITASIGVFGGKFVLSGLWEKIGVSWDRVTTSRNATIWSSNSRYGESERARMDAALDRIYEDFTTKVAEGREIPIERVREIAKGRVWTGEEARELGLVDDLGGYSVALRQVREAAGLASDAPLRVKRFPETRSLLDLILDRTSGRGAAEAAALVRVAGELGTIIDALRRLGILEAPPGPLYAPEGLPVLP